MILIVGWATHCDCPALFIDPRPLVSQRLNRYECPNHIPHALNQSPLPNRPIQQSYKRQKETPMPCRSRVAGALFALMCSHRAACRPIVCAVHGTIRCIVVDRHGGAPLADVGAVAR